MYILSSLCLVESNNFSYNFIYFKFSDFNISFQEFHIKMSLFLCNFIFDGFDMIKPISIQPKSTITYIKITT